MNSVKFPRLLILSLFSFLPMVILGCGTPTPGTTVTLTVVTEGSGTVTPGTSYVPVGKEISLKATPKSGWKFDHWEGPVTGSTNPVTITVNADVTVKAVFVSGTTHRTPEVYNLTVTTAVNVPVSIKLEGYSPDDNTLTFTAAAPTHGSLGGSAPLVTYIPKVGFEGVDSFTYTAKDSYNESSAAKVNVEVVTAAATGWAKSFGSTETDRIYAVTYDSIGNVYICGKFSGTVDFDPSAKSDLYASAGKTDAFLAKYSRFGEFQWVRTLGGAENDAGTALTTDSANNVYIIGTFSDTIAVDAKTGTNLTSPNGTGAFICQFTSAGEFGWARSFSGNEDASGYAAGFDPVGNVYVAGSFSGQVTFNALEGKDKFTAYGLRDGFITKLTTAGTYVWTAIVGGAAVDEVTAMAVEPTGIIYITGYFGSVFDLDPGATTENVTAFGISDVFLVKLNPSGQKVWGKTIGGAGKEQAYAVAVNDLGEVAIGGTFEQSFDFDSSSASDVHISGGKTDGFVTRYTSAGVYRWTRVFGGTGDDQVNGLAFDTESNLYVAGGFSGQTNFMRSFGGSDLKTSVGLMDAFATRITDTGGYGATVKVGGLKDDVANTISFSRIDLTLYWGGSFQETANLDPRLNKIETHNAFGGDDCFLIRTTADFGW
jgi:hypothetical protein